MSVVSVEDRRPSNVVEIPAEILERVLVSGDLKDLTATQRVVYYRGTCQSLGLNMLTKPFEYILLNGKLTLYALKGCTDQIRGQRHVNVIVVSREKMEDLFVVTARATEHLGTPLERSDESIGAVSIAGLRGEALANALMKAETKAKRRATLSLCGLGMLDETEVESARDARRVKVDHGTGEIIEVEPVRQGQGRPQPAQPVGQCDPGTIQNVGQFLSAALREWRMNRTQVLAALDARSTDDLGPNWADHWATLTARNDTPAADSGDGAAV